MGAFQRPVAMIGGAVTFCKDRWETATFQDLARMAVQATLANAKMTPEEIESAVACCYNDIFQRMVIPDSMVWGGSGLYNIPGPRITNGGATGAYGIRAGVMEVASGASDAVVVFGFEKATDNFDPASGTATPAVIEAIAKSWDPHYEYPNGATANDSYTQMCMGYNDAYPGDIDDPEIRATIVEMLGRQGNRSTIGQRRNEPVTKEQVLRSRWIIAPFLRLLEVCMYTEGAAGVIFASEKKAREISERTGRPIVWVRGIGACNEPYFAGHGEGYKPLNRMISDHIASERAYAMAGVRPSDIQLVELHDAYLAQLMMTMAEMGFVPLGQSRNLLTEGVMADIRELADDQAPPKGKVLINPSGGLIFCGHMVGASNILSLESTYREMINRQIEWGLFHGTGAINANYSVVGALQLDEAN